MLTYQEFERYMTNILEARDLYDKMYAMFMENSTLLGDATPPMPTGYFLAEEILGKAMGLGNDDIISYWIDEMRSQEQWKDVILDENLPEGHKYRNPEIKNIEDLYNYCVFLSEEYAKKKEGK